MKFDSNDFVRDLRVEWHLKNVWIKVHWLWVRPHMQNLSGCNFLLSLIILSSLDILPPNYSFHNADKRHAIYGIWVPIIPPANHSESSALGPTTEYLPGNFQVFFLETFYNSEIRVCLFASHFSFVQPVLTFIKNPIANYGF